MKIKEIDYTKYQTVAFTGDIHGDFRQLVGDIASRDELHNALVVVCGDIGLGFCKMGYYTDTFEWMERRLNKIGTTVVMFRGNHDNPEWFYTDKYPEIKSFKHIVIIDDYTILRTTSGNVLCIGGAVSIDRCVRIPDISWWRNEVVQYPDDELYTELDKIDINIVATHTCPGVIGPQFNNAMGYEMYDNEIVVDLNDERCKMSDMYNRLSDTHDIRYWFYGHFHNHYTDRLGTTLFIGCDMMRDHVLDYVIVPNNTSEK